MEDGKSETWLNVATQIVEEKGRIDYIAKMDGDTMLFLDKFVDYLDAFLPPYPFNSNTIMGKAATKHEWIFRKKKEAFFALRHHYDRGSGFGHLQYYVQGQFYGMSPNVATEIVQEAKQKRVERYRHGYEDADISTMAANLPHSLQFQFIKSPNLFWRHPVKIKAKGSYPVKLNALESDDYLKVWRDEFRRLASVWNTTSL